MSQNRQSQQKVLGSSRKFRAYSFLGCVLAFVVFLLGACAQDIPDIDRTQPRAVKKSIFRAKNEDGSLRTWYYQRTVIDVPYGSAVTFIGEQTETEMVVWEITERFLYAYRSYEYVKNSEKPQQRSNTGDYQGAAVAAFTIESHFDIQRSYNASTGEQNNVIVENTTDRPWHERQYMRVDFSKNLITDFNFVAATVQQNPVGYYIPETETNNKDRAKIEEGYIDVVHKLYAAPQVDPELTMYYGEPVPVCWLYADMTNDCLGQTIKIRSSFVPVGNRGYKAEEYSQLRMDKFGYFRTTRYGYDRQYGVTEQDTKFYINRWNIWNNPNQCVSAGTKPYANCQTRQIPIYVNEQFPANLKSAMATVMSEWNKTFGEMVREITGKDQGPVFVLCPNNPVIKGDPNVCGEVGTNPQIGDLRYSMLYWVDAPGRASPLGYGPSAIDPQTGEIVAASAFVYGAELDMYANYATDFVRVLNGDIKPQDITNENHVKVYFENLQRSQQTNRRYWSAPKGAKIKRQARLEKRKSEFKERLKRGVGRRDWVSANLRKLKDAPGLEDILKGEVFKALGLHVFSPDGQITPKIRQHYGFDRIASRNLFAWSTLRMKRLARRNIMMADFIDDSIISRALQLKKQYADGQGHIDYDKIRLSLREATFVSTMLHEVGHILGLRHNFAGSADALNYHDKYWELKAKTVPPGEKTPLPEYRYTKEHVHLLDDAIRDGMREFQYSSIMDYGGSFASDLQGLGKYDRAAIMYGYGNLVDVFKQTALKQRNEANTKLSAEEWHYTQLPVLIAGNTGNYDAQTKALLQSNRRWVPESEVKAQASLIEIPYRFCSDEYIGGNAHCYPYDQGADYYERVQGFANRYWHYYIFDAFKRGRVAFGDIGEYLGRIYGRYFSPIADQYKHFLNDWWFSGAGFSCGGEDWYVEPACGENGFVAALTSLNFFARVLQVPDAGCYRRPANNANDKFVNVSTEACTNGTSGGYTYLNIPLGVGRQMLSSFSYQKYGYEFAWKPTSIGAWWDKYMAVMALGDPYTNFVGVDTDSNFNNYMINFNTMFGRYVNNVLGGFIINRHQVYAPVIQNNNMIFRDLIQISGDNPDLLNPAPRYTGNVVDPNEQYSAQYYAGLLGTIYFSQDLNDQFFNESLKISVRGRDDSPEVPEDIKKDPNKYIEIVDPGSQRIYYAAKVDNAEGLFEDQPAFFSVGYELLKQIKDKYYEADGRTLKKGIQRWEIEYEFQFINVVVGWLRAGEYNRDTY